MNHRYTILRSSPRAAGLHAADRLRERVLPQRDAEIRDDLCRRVDLLEQPHQRRTGNVAPVASERSLVSSKPKEMIALVVRESQRLRDRVNSLLGGAGAPALF